MFLKKLFGLEKSEPETQVTEKNSLTIKNTQDCLCISGSKTSILIFPSTILHIHMSGQLHKNAGPEVLDITGRFAGCKYHDNNSKLSIELDMSSDFKRKVRTINVFPKSWDGYTDIWINGFHINYKKVGEDNGYIKIEKRLLFLISDGYANKLFLSGLKVKFGDYTNMLSPDFNNIGVLKSIGYNVGDSLYSIIDCSKRFNEDVQTYNFDSLGFMECASDELYCIVTNCYEDQDYTKTSGIMNIDICEYLHDHISECVDFMR